MCNELLTKLLTIISRWLEQGCFRSTLEWEALWEDFDGTNDEVENQQTM